jgi:hypothetical protein
MEDRSFLVMLYMDNILVFGRREELKYISDLFKLSSHGLQGMFPLFSHILTYHVRTFICTMAPATFVPAVKSRRKHWNMLLLAPMPECPKVGRKAGMTS